MAKFFSLLIVLLLAVWGGIKIAEDPGYALFVYQSWSVEMPIWLCFVGLLIGLFIFYWVVRIILGLGFCHHRVSDWLGSRKKTKAHRSLCNGIVELVEGNAKRSEKYLQQHVLQSKTPLIHYLFSAKAAQSQKALDRRDNYLHLAKNADPSADLAIGITKAELQIEAQQFDGAIKTLTCLDTVSNHHPLVLKMLCKLFIKQKDWHHLHKLLPLLKKQKVLEETKLLMLEQEVIVKEIAATNEGELSLFWNGLSRQVKRMPQVILAYAKRLKVANDAEELLRETLKKSWNEELAHYYGEINANASIQLKYALQWLKRHPESSGLYITIANLSARESMWGQAREYFEKSLEIDSAPATLYAFAECLERQGELDLARSYYKKACQL